MSTRCNIFIKKADYDQVQIYHHSDGYPSGVGKELADFCADTLNNNEKVLENPDIFANYLEDQDMSYEVEGHMDSPHGDIDYLYIVDLSKKTITCIEVERWDPNTKTFDKTPKEIYVGKMEDQFENYYKED